MPSNTVIWITFWIEPQNRYSDSMLFPPLIQNLFVNEPIWRSWALSFSFFFFFIFNKQVSYANNSRIVHNGMFASCKIAIRELTHAILFATFENLTKNSLGDLFKCILAQNATLSISVQSMQLWNICVMKNYKRPVTIFKDRYSFLKVAG